MPFLDFSILLFSPVELFLAIIITIIIIVITVIRALFRSRLQLLLLLLLMLMMRLKVRLVLDLRWRRVLLWMRMDRILRLGWRIVLVLLLQGCDPVPVLVVLSVGFPGLFEAELLLVEGFRLEGTFLGGYPFPRHPPPVFQSTAGQSFLTDLAHFSEESIRTMCGGLLPLFPALRACSLLVSTGRRSSGGGLRGRR